MKQGKLEVEVIELEDGGAELLITMSEDIDKIFKDGATLAGLTKEQFIIKILTDKMKEENWQTD